MLPPTEYDVFLNASVELARRVRKVLEIDPSEHATTSRDYGRGFAACHKLVLDILNNSGGDK